MRDKYIETRPEAIEAIKKAIDEKWNQVCMGCSYRLTCSLCQKYERPGTSCDDCPLEKSGNNCYEEQSTFYLWCFDSSPSKAESMLEALVQLLPPEHRIKYGG